MLGDLRFALRQLRKSPGFAVAAILTLAIGIGANAAMFSVTDATMLRPLAVPELGRVVAVSEVQNRDTPKWVALGNYEEWVRQSESFEGLAVWTHEHLDLTGAGDAAQVEAAAVSANFFGLLRVQPLLGRSFRPDEAQRGRGREVVLSHSLWQRQFGGAPDIVGKQMELDGSDYLVIGVMPKTFEYPLATDLFLPLVPTPAQRVDRDSRNYQVIGRLRPGVSVQAAQAEMNGIASRLAKTYPATNVGWGVKVEPLRDKVIGTLTPMIMNLILAATGIVLLIVCANVANLQFAHGLGRRNEMAVRSALGARPRRLMRQLLAESVLLGLAGAAGGLLLAKLDLQMILAMMPASVARFVPGWENISLNGRALALAIVLAVVAGVLSGLAPAREALRVNLVEHLKSDGRTATGSAGTHRLRNGFAVAQIALAVALVIGAALMAKGMFAMLHRDDVHEPKQVLTFDLNLPSQRYDAADKRAAWYVDSLSRLRALPGVKAAAVTTTLPDGSEGTWDDSFQIDNRPVVPGHWQTASRLAVSAGFLGALHIPIVEGRGFDGSDGLNTTPVAMVSRNFAQRYFPGTSPLGHKIRMGVARNGGEPEMTIVGVVNDVQYLWIDPAPEPAIYLDAAQQPPTGARYAVVTDDPLALAATVRKTLAGLDPTVPLNMVQTYSQYLHDSMVGLINAATNMAIDAAIALLLAAIGIFGVMANLVGERRREIGVRLTMGADRGDVLRLFLRKAGILTGIGLAIGLPLAAALAMAAANMLYGVRALDVSVFVTAIVSIAGIALLAGYIPARRAAMVEPVEALRNE